MYTTLNVLLYFNRICRLYIVSSPHWILYSKDLFLFRTWMPPDESGTIMQTADWEVICWWCRCTVERWRASLCNATVPASVPLWWQVYQTFGCHSCNNTRVVFWSAPVRLHLHEKRLVTFWKNHGLGSSVPLYHPFLMHFWFCCSKFDCGSWFACDVGELHFASQNEHDLLLTQVIGSDVSEIKAAQFGISTFILVVMCLSSMHILTQNKVER